MSTTVTIACSGTRTERWYRDIVAVVARCTPNDARFDIAACDPALVAKLRALWLHRMESEHRSTAVFASLAWQLMEAGASLDQKAMVLSMAHDELRHTELCGRVVETLGGEARCEVENVSAQMPAHRGCSPEERALRNVIYGSCMSEVVNSARFVALLDATKDPFMRNATRQLLADEVTHAQFGFYYLDAWQPWLEVHPEVRASIARYLRYAFAVYERNQAGGDGSFVRRSDDELSVGLPDPSQNRDVFYQTLEHAVLPGLERYGIEATNAWRTRTLDAP
jgi:hypothetical protein